jgi:hypothetical protein
MSIVVENQIVVWAPKSGDWTSRTHVVLARNRENFNLGANICNVLI